MKRKITAFAATLTLSGMVFGASFAQAAPYEVEEGDTLWSIANKHQTTVDTLYKLNDLSSDLIFPNQALQIDDETEGNEEIKQEKQLGTNKYKVVAGDSLWKVANQYNVSITSLKEWNQLSSDLIHPGNTLIVKGTDAPQQAIVQEPVKQQQKQPNQTQQAKQEKKQPTQNSQKASGKEMTVEATAYTAFCNGCSGVTAAGIDLRANPDQKVIAVDPSVIPLGTKVYVEGYGEAIAGDIGSAIKGNKIDVFISEQSAALNWGRKTVKIKILN